MKSNALIVNCARGEIVNSEDLAEALESGRIFGAALDTVYPEPPTAEHPLMKISDGAKDRLIITAHVAGTSDKVFRNMLNGGINNMKRVAAGERPVNIQNGL